MKLALTAALLLTLNQAAFAEVRGGSFDDGDGITYGPPETPAPKNVVRKQPTIRPPAPIAEPKAQVAPPMDIKPKMETQAAPAVAAAPVNKAQVTIAQGGCAEPVAHPDASKTPVEVWVDQKTQTITIQTPDRKEPLVDKVSTGGGLKVPNGTKVKKDPYCARTPKIEKVISAVEESDFAGTTCNAEEIRSRSTVFKDYRSRTFTDKEGREVPMPNAIRIEGGIFFHTVPPSYVGLMGQNVSGECIRLYNKTSSFLQAQIKKYGAIKVHISEPPEVDPRAPNYCDENKVAQAKLDQKNGTMAPTAQSTGTEGVVGGEKSAENLFAKWETSPFNLFRKGGLFNPDSQPQTQAAQPPRPKANVGPARRI